MSRIYGTVIFKTINEECHYCHVPDRKDGGFPLCLNPHLCCEFAPERNTVIDCPEDHTMCPEVINQDVHLEGDIDIIKEVIDMNQVDGWLSFTQEEWMDVKDCLKLNDEPYVYWLFMYFGYVTIHQKEIDKEEYYTVLTHESNLG